MKEGPGEGTRCRPSTVHVARHGRTRSEKSREAVPRAGVFHHFPLGCQTALKRASCSRRCCTVFGGAYVGSLQAAQAGVASRGHLSWRGKAATSSLDPLMYPIPSERETYPSWSIYNCTWSAFSPTNSVVYNM